MHRLFTVIIIFAMVLNFTACSTPNDNPATSQSQATTASAQAAQSSATSTEVSSVASYVASSAASSAPENTTEAASGTNINPKGVFPIVDEKITLDTFANLNPEADVDNNAFLKWVEQETNVEIKITHQVTSTSEVVTQRTMLFASGNYPGLFLMYNTPFTAADQVQYGIVEGILIPLNDLYDQYADNMKQLHDEFPIYKQISYAPDGNVYGYAIPGLTGHARAYPKLWINMDWLTALNMEVPTTTQGFKDMLIAFRDLDPSGVGKENVIPLSADIDDPLDTIFVNSFIPYNTSARWYEGTHHCYADESGKIIFSADKPEFKEALLYMNDLWSENLIDIAAYSQTEQQAKQTVMQKPARVGSFVAGHLGQYVETTDTEMYNAYRSVAPMEGPGGVRYQASPGGLTGMPSPSASYAITDRCERPDVAFRIIDFFLGEDASIQYWGVEGIDWEYAPEGALNIRGGECRYLLISHPPESEERKTSYNRTFDPGPHRNTLAFRDLYAPMRTEEELFTNADYYAARLEYETIPLVQYIYPISIPRMFFMSTEETNEFTQLYTDLNAHVIRSVAEFVTGSRDIDKDWENYLAELNGFGLPRFLEIYQAAYDDFRGKQ